MKERDFVVGARFVLVKDDIGQHAIGGKGAILEVIKVDQRDPYRPVITFMNVSTGVTTCAVGRSPFCDNYLEPADPLKRVERWIDKVRAA